MAKCFICGKEINKEAVEHIIPSALGGKLTADILCKDHNSFLGSDIDADAIDVLSYFTNILNPTRGRGGNAPDLVYNSSKGKIKRSATGELSHEQIRPVTDKKGNTGITISIMGENAEEKAKKISNAYIQRMGSKQGWSAEQIHREIEKSDAYIQNKAEIIQCPELSISLGLGDKNSWLGILKIAVEYAIMNDINKEYFDDKIKILNERDVEKAKCFSGFYYPEELYDQTSICHTLILIANNQERVLYCLISLYNVWNSLVILSDNYDGQDLRKCYCYDLLNKEDKSHQQIKPHVVKRKFLDEIRKPSVDNLPKLEKHIKQFNNFFSYLKH